MVEIALLLAGAETAISTIKRAVAVGKDAHDLFGQFCEIFDAQDAIIKASTDERSNIRAKNDEERSAMSEALESVAASRKIQQMVEGLKHYIVWELQEPALWDQIMMERNAIIQRRKAAELAAQRAAQKRKQEIGEMIEISFALLFAVVVLGALIYGGLELLEYTKARR